MPSTKLPVNDGWTDVAHDLGTDAADKSSASRLACELQARPGLARRLLNTDDRVVKMITYRALELLELTDAPGQ
jgi:hypothetical protein